MTKMDHIPNPSLFFKEGDRPHAEGELTASWVRLILSGLAMVIVAGYYFAQGDPVIETALAVSFAAFFAWACLSAVVGMLIRRGRYRAYISIFSALLDISVVSICQIAFMLYLPFNFVNGPVTIGYFVLIGMGAFRKSGRLVAIESVFASVVHLTISAAAYQSIPKKISFFAHTGGADIENHIVDDLAIAAALVVFGFMIAHMTKVMRSTERHYDELFNNVPDGIVILSPAGRMAQVNQRFAQMVGRAKEELLGRPVVGYMGQFSTMGVQTSIARYGSGQVTTLNRWDGTSLDVRTSAVPIQVAEETYVEVSFRDVTEEIRLEKELAQSQKMDTVGKLARGLVHDFNNMLAGIFGAISVSERVVNRLEDGPSKERLVRNVKAIFECSRNASEVVGRLSSLASGKLVETSPVDLRSVLTEVSSICEQSFGQTHTIEVENRDNPLIASIDDTSLKQAILNLCINARDAMPDGGTIKLRIASADEILKEGTAPVGYQDEDLCCVQVEDHGHGIEPDQISQIFDPFFSTKPKDEGTGLGLTMVYSIAKQHGGFVDVRSEPGKGSTFSVFVSTSRDSLLPPSPEDGYEGGLGRQRVLVVDDDPMVRSTITEMLTQQGHSAYVARDGEHAIEMIAGSNLHFDLVMLDMMMPGLDGKETLVRIKKHRPDLKVMIVSGFMQDTSEQDIKTLGAVAFLRKPFTLEDLAEMLNKVIRN